MASSVLAHPKPRPFPSTFRPSTTASARASWKVETCNTRSDQISPPEFHSFQLINAGDAIASLGTAFSSSEPASLTITTLSNGCREFCILVNGKEVKSFAEKKIAPASHKSTSAVELYICHSRNNKRKCLESSSNRADVGSSPMKLRRLNAPVQGTFVGGIDERFWRGQQGINDRTKSSSAHANLSHMKKDSCSSSLLSLDEYQEAANSNPLKRYPQLCMPELMLQAKHAKYLSSYIRCLNLSAPAARFVSDCVSVNKKAARALMLRIKSALDANAALFSNLAADANTNNDINRISVRAPPAVRTDVSNLLCAHRSNDIRVLLKAYKCLVAACTGND